MINNFFSSAFAIMSSKFFAMRKHWLTTLTVVLALVGGVPGVIAIYDYFCDKPEVAISVLRFDTGEIRWPDETERYSYVLLEMEVFNETNKAIPLPSNPFDLSSKVNGRWVQFKQTTIPLSGTVLYNDMDKKSSANIDHMDLQKYRELNTGRLYGHFQPTVHQQQQYLGSKHYILFLTKDVSPGQIKNAITEGL